MSGVRVAMPLEIAHNFEITCHVVGSCIQLYSYIGSKLSPSTLRFWTDKSPDLRRSMRKDSPICTTTSP